MIQVRRSNERGHADHGWLDTYHTFSFASYRDPAHTRFRSLRVMNEDTIAPGQGFGTHPHQDMEIVTYVLKGALEHRDSMGNGEVLRAGEFQRMSAGTGITHSELNPSSDQPAHLYQIWLFPKTKGITPSYEQRRFDPDGRRNRWQLVASPDATEDSLAIHQDAHIFLADLDSGEILTHPLSPNRYAWVQILRGTVSVDGTELSAGDGVAISSQNDLRIHGKTPSEIMLFDLA